MSELRRKGRRRLQEIRGDALVVVGQIDQLLATADADMDAVGRVRSLDEVLSRLMRSVFEFRQRPRLFKRPGHDVTPPR